MNWDIEVGSETDWVRRTHDLLLRVKIPDNVIADLHGSRMQHQLVDYVAKRLHEFIESEFSTKRLPAMLKKHERCMECERIFYDPESYATRKDLREAYGQGFHICGRKALPPASQQTGENK